MKEIIFLFLIYAVIGWLWETPFVSIKEKKWINRGFLRGPYIPIYGFSCISIVLVLNVLNLSQNNHPLIILVQMMIISLISLVWEFGTSWLLEKLFKQRWWDYSYKRFNLQGRVTLDFTILFGFGGFLLWRFVNPILINLYNGINAYLLNWLLMIMSLVFIIDAFVTLIDLIKIRKFMTKFGDLKDNLSLSYRHLMLEIKSEFTSSKVSIVDKIDQLKRSVLSETSKKKVQWLIKVSELEHLIGFSRKAKRIYAKFPRLVSFINKKEKEDKE